ncbi:MAG: SpoIID/LytB domain-containing protein [Acidobacteriota bacterium]
MKRSAILAIIMVLVSACGGGKRQPPLPPTAPPTVSTQSDTLPAPSATSSPPDSKSTIGQKFPLGSLPTIRVLLRENFKTAQIEGAGLSPLLWAEFKRGKVHLLTPEEEGLVKAGSGFRLEPAGSAFLKLDGESYRGVLDIFINPLGTAVIVNELSLEDYLQGVVPNELGPARFPEMEALKAQAVAGRTYAIHHLGSFASRGFDAYTDHRSQVYKGLASEHSVSNRAVAETRGVVIVYGGEPILALYSSTCGGKTRSFSQAYQRSPISYLQGGVECEDSSSPFHSWERQVPISKIQPSLDRLGGIGKLKEIKVLDKDSGMITEVLLSGEAGNKVLSGERLRFALGLPSSYILELKNNRRDGAVTEVRAVGRGWGHGVGMCQIGAVELARQGHSYEEILKRYYKDVELVRAY